MSTDPLLELPEAECLRLLEHARFGRIGFIEHDRPVVLPVNYLFDEGVILFRSTSGSKLEAALKEQTVAFEVDAIDPMYHGGWSVLAYGVAEVVIDPDEIQRLSRLPVRPWWPGAQDRWIRIPVDEISGRRLRADPD